MRPLIVEKVLMVTVLMVWAFVTWDGYETVKFKLACRDAGGVPTATVCINPSAVIEVK